MEVYVRISDTKKDMSARCELYIMLYLGFKALVVTAKLRVKCCKCDIRTCIA